MKKIKYSKFNIKALQKTLEKIKKENEKMWYVLDEDFNPVKTTLADSNLYLIDNRKIKNDILIVKNNVLTISTVFLGFDHSYSSADKPVLFETMLFDDTREEGNNLFSKFRDIQYRYDSYYKACYAHDFIVRLYKNILYN